MKTFILTGDFVGVWVNPLSAESCEEKIPVLETHGVIMGYEYK